MMMKRGGGALTEQSTRPLCPWLPLGTGFGVPPRWGRGGERVRVTEPAASTSRRPLQHRTPYTRHNESRALGKKRDLR